MRQFTVRCSPLLNLPSPAARLLQALSRAGSGVLLECSPSATNAVAVAGAGLAKPTLSPARRRRQRQDTDYAPTSSSEGSPVNARLGMLSMPGPEPLSPINLLPRYEPPSPVSINLQLCGEPSPSQSGRQQPGDSPSQRPYSQLYGSLGSPLISLAPRPAPPSPMAAGGLNASGTAGSPGSGGAGGGGTSGLTLLQLLQQYPSSGYTPRGSRRGSLDHAGVFRDSTRSEASDAADHWRGYD